MLLVTPNKNVYLYHWLRGDYRGNLLSIQPVRDVQNVNLDSSIWIIRFGFSLFKLETESVVDLIHMNPIIHPVIPISNLNGYGYPPTEHVKGDIGCPFGYSKLNPNVDPIRRSGFHFSQIQTKYGFLSDPKRNFFHIQPI